MSQTTKPQATGKVAPKDGASLSIVMVGEVDHGKSSVVGRILHDTGAISQSRIDSVKSICKEQGKEFEYAFLLDAFEERVGQLRK